MRASTKCQSALDSAQPHRHFGILGEAPFRPAAGLARVVVAVRMRMAVSMAVMRFLAMVMLVAVVPEFGLVEQEEDHQAAQQYAEQQARLDAALEGLGQQVHEGGRQQSAGREAQQVLRIDAAAAAHAHAQQQCGDPDTSDAGDQGRGKDDEQVHDGFSKENKKPPSGRLSAESGASEAVNEPGAPEQPVRGPLGVRDELRGPGRRRTGGQSRFHLINRVKRDALVLF